MDVVAVVEEEGEGEGEDEILDKSSRTGSKSQCTDAQPSPTLVRPRPSAATSAPAPLAGSHSRSTQGPIQPGPSRSLVLVLSEGTTTTNTRPKVHLSYSGTSLLRLLGLPVVHTPSHFASKYNYDDIWCGPRGPGVLPPGTDWYSVARRPKFGEQASHETRRLEEQIANVVLCH